MTFPVIDLHCDALSRYESESRDVSGYLNCDASLTNLRTGHVKVQAFAIFVSPSLSQEEKLKSALNQIYYFFEHVVRPEKHVVHITEWSQIAALKNHEIGAFLTIEGVDFFEGDIRIWHIFRRFGVLSIGLTWNGSNEAADGVGEDLGRGIADFGKEIIALNNEHKILTDVSHLSEKSFWGVLEHAKYIIASHSNAKALCPHRRNLSDEQILAMVQKQAQIHVVYNPPFINLEKVVYIKDLIKHIDHICSLGGKAFIGLGSDFDGIESKVVNLETAAQHQNLLNELLKYYSEEDVRGFAYQNFINYYPN